MAPRSTQCRPVRERLATVVTGTSMVASWFALAIVAWLVLLCLDDRASLDRDGILLRVELSCVYSALMGGALAITHGLRHALLLRFGSPRGHQLHLALMAVVLAFPCRTVAHLLTSGRGIRAVAHTDLIRLGFFGILLVSWLALWQWHIVGLRQDIARRRRLLWGSAGLLVAVSLVYVMDYRLTSYLYLARHLLPALWLILASMAFASLRGQGARIWGPVLGAVLLIFLLRPFIEYKPEPARAQMYTSRRVSALTDMAVPGSSVAPMRIDVLKNHDFACPPWAAPAREPLSLSEAQRKNVILISVDALRLDGLEERVDGRFVMPRLRAFRDQALDFRRAVTAYPATFLGIGSALTGRLPSGIVGAPHLPQNIFAGTRSVFGAQHIIVPDDVYFRTDVIEGLWAQGTPMEFILDERAQARALLRGLSESRRAGQRHFAWAHLLGTHTPYRQHAEHDFGSGPKQRYLSELAYIDDVVGTLLDELRDGGWFEDSLIVIFSDHGESVGELNYFGHHVYLNRWMTDVPLWVHYPGVAPQSSRQPASTTAIAATIRHFLELPDEPSDAPSLFSAEPEFAISESFPLQGRHFLLLGRNPAQTISELQARLNRLQDAGTSYGPKVALATSSHRLILERDTHVWSLFDRDADSMETDNLAFGGDAVVAELKTLLARWHRRQSQALYCGLRSAR